MLIFDRENWPYHRIWCLFTVLATLAATLWYGWYGLASGAWAWPSGGSPPGFACGVAGGAIILFEMLLWPRKSLWRGWRLGRTKLWMTAHIWLGLLALPLLLLHGGFHFGLGASTLSAVIMWLLVLVIGSGIFGLIVQNIVPRMMLDQVPAETITSQIGHVLEQYRDEAERLVVVTCGPSAATSQANRDRAIAEAGAESSVVSVGTLRTVGRVQGKVVQVGVTASYVGESEPLRTFFENCVDPYLAASSGKGMPLASRRQAATRFQALKETVRPEVHPVVDRLADLCDQRRQFDVQTRLQHWLTTWLGIHVALSVALLVLMLVHIVLALKYI